jgi:hypothetical protein
MNNPSLCGGWGNSPGCPLKTNRKVAWSQADRPQGRYVRVDTLDFEAYASKIVYLEGVACPLVLVKQVCTNKDC